MRKEERCTPQGCGRRPFKKRTLRIVVTTLGLTGGLVFICVTSSRLLVHTAYGTYVDHESRVREDPPPAWATWVLGHMPGRERAIRRMIRAGSRGVRLRGLELAKAAPARVLAQDAVEAGFSAFGRLCELGGEGSDDEGQRLFITALSASEAIVACDQDLANLDGWRDGSAERRAFAAFVVATAAKDRPMARRFVQDLLRSPPTNMYARGWAYSSIARARLISSAEAEELALPLEKWQDPRAVEDLVMGLAASKSERLREYALEGRSKGSPARRVVLCRALIAFGVFDETSVETLLDGVARAGPRVRRWCAIELLSRLPGAFADTLADSTDVRLTTCEDDAGVVPLRSLLADHVQHLPDNSEELNGIAQAAQGWWKTNKEQIGWDAKRGHFGPRSPE